MSELGINLDLNQIKEISYINNEPEWLKEYRLKSFDYFKKLPIEVSQLYIKHYDITGLDISQSSLNLNLEIKIPSELESILKSFQYIPYILILDGKIAHINLPEPLKNQGLIISDLTSYFNNDYLKEIWNLKTISNEEDKIAALNDAFFYSGYFIKIPHGLQLKVPIRILNIATKEGILSFMQNFIINGNDVKITVIEENFSIEEMKKQSLISQNVNIHLGENSEMEYIYVNSNGENINNFTNRRILCKKDSRVSWVFGYFGGLINRSKNDNRMIEQGVITNTIEILVSSSKERYDLTTYLSHLSSYTKSVSISKGVLKDESRVLLKGMIKIAENARNSDAYLAEHAMILNRGSRADSIPGLEIANNDVRATHSASVAQIDEEQLFYLMSRGLSEIESKKLLTFGFFQPLIDQIPLEVIKDKFIKLIEDKLEGRKSSLKEKIIETEEIKEVKQISPEQMFTTHYKYRK